MAPVVVAGIVLAAGRSSRMGQSKALLPHRDPATTFVAHVIRELHGAAIYPIVVVGRAADEDLRKIVAEENAAFVINHNADAGQLSSLIAGLDALADVRLDAVLMLPVDVPLVTSHLVRTLLDRAAATGAPIVRAVHAGVHGHPVLFTRSIFEELRNADPEVGARAVVRADPSRVVDIELDDPGIVADVDTPEDYERLFGRRPDDRRRSP